MEDRFRETLESTIWVAHQLFRRKLVTGSTGNISFLYEDTIYISQSGCCFGTLHKDSFAKIDMSGKIICGNPSKEYPLHIALYKRNNKNTVVIHTHSLYCTAVSCMEDIQKCIDKLFSYTPYFEMITNGNVNVVPYYKPGSKELFKAFNEAIIQNATVTILRNHGVVVASNLIESAFYIIEEFEVSASLLFLLDYQRDFEVRTIK